MVLSFCFRSIFLSREWIFGYFCDNIVDFYLRFSVFDCIGYKREDLL